MPVASPLRTPLSQDRIVHPHIYNGAITESGARITNTFPHQGEVDSEKPRFPFPQVEHGEQAQGLQLIGDLKKLAEGNGIIPVSGELDSASPAQTGRYMDNMPVATLGLLNWICLMSNQVRADFPLIAFL